MNATRVLTLVAAFCTGCGGPSLRGALALENGREFEAAARGQLVPRNCRDGRNAPALAPSLRVQRVRLNDGREAALELRRGYDAVLITNAYDDRGGRVFQYVSDDGQHEILHVLHFGPLLTGARLELTDAFFAPGSGAEFRATARRISLTCELIPEPPDAGPLPALKAEPPVGSR